MGINFKEHKEKSLSFKELLNGDTFRFISESEGIWMKVEYPIDEDYDDDTEDIAVNLSTGICMKGITPTIRVKKIKIEATVIE